MQGLQQMPSLPVSDDAILNAKNEGDRMLQSAMKALKRKLLTLQDPSKQEIAKNKLNNFKLLISKIHEAAKQKHAVIDQKFDEMQMKLDQETKMKIEQQKRKQNQQRKSQKFVSTTFQFGSLKWRITVRKPGNDNGELNESEIERLTESMMNTIAQVQQKHDMNNHNKDRFDTDNNIYCDTDCDDLKENEAYKMDEILKNIEEDGSAEPEPDFGYDHCNNWMCYRCQHINPVTFENLTDPYKKCENCGSNGWPTKEEMTQMMENSKIKYGEYFKKIMQ